jgi:hypothetical protein
MNIRYPALAAIFTLLTTASAIAQQATAYPSPQATVASSPTASPANRGKHLGQVKKLRAGTLTAAQVRYAMAHASQEAAKLRSMKTVKFENLRVYRAPASLRATLHASVSEIAYAPVRLNDALAQTTSSNPLLSIFANINVVDALNNTLNGNTVGVSLNDVLNANNIAIGQVLGVYIGGGGIITTII